MVLRTHNSDLTCNIFMVYNITCTISCIISHVQYHMHNITEGTCIISHVYYIYDVTCKVSQIQYHMYNITYMILHIRCHVMYHKYNIICTISHKNITCTISHVWYHMYNTTNAISHKFLFMQIIYWWNSFFLIIRLFSPLLNVNFFFLLWSDFIEANEFMFCFIICLFHLIRIRKILIIRES